MNHDYWSTPAAARELESIGYQNGAQAGHQEGYRKGVERGRREVWAEIQPQLNSANAQIAQSNAQLSSANELVQGMAQILAAAADALLQADDAAKISFALKYADRLEKALAKGLIHSAPHNNPELAGLSVVMRLVDESRRACLQATESNPTP